MNALTCYWSGTPNRGSIRRRSSSSIFPSAVTKNRLADIDGGTGATEFERACHHGPSRNRAEFFQCTVASFVAEYAGPAFGRKSDDLEFQNNFDALDRALRENNKKVKSIRYVRGGGHNLFHDAGYYLADVKAFLHENLDASEVRYAGRNLESEL
jgi:monomeric isocitrate dehydrogenase